MHARSRVLVVALRTHYITCTIHLYCNFAACSTAPHLPSRSLFLWCCCCGRRCHCCFISTFDIHIHTENKIYAITARHTHISMEKCFFFLSKKCILYYSYCLCRFCLRVYCSWLRVSQLRFFASYFFIFCHTRSPIAA